MAIGLNANPKSTRQVKPGDTESFVTALRGIGLSEKQIQGLLEMSREELLELVPMLEELNRSMQAGNRPEAV